MLSSNGLTGRIRENEARASGCLYKSAERNENRVEPTAPHNTARSRRFDDGGEGLYCRWSGGRGPIRPMPRGLSSRQGKSTEFKLPRHSRTNPLLTGPALGYSTRMRATQSRVCPGGFYCKRPASTSPVPQCPASRGMIGMML